MEKIIRCAWVTEDPLYQSYHDEEWGVPEHNDDRLFEKLILDGAQAGLSWITILKKRENYRKAFNGFDAGKIARYGERDREWLLADAGIVRNRAKIDAAIGNARAYLAMKEKGISFDEFLWQFVGGETITNHWKHIREIPAETKESVVMSKALRAAGFKFVGPTIIYAFMQAVGMVNDHTLDCWRSGEQ